MRNTISSPLPDVLSTSQRLSVFTASCALAAMALNLVLMLTLTPAYAEFIVGNIAWDASSKFQDLAAPPVLIVSFCCAFILLSRHVGRLRARGEQQADTFCEQLVWWAIPSAIVIAGMLTGAAPDGAILTIAACGIGALSLSSMLTIKSERRLDGFMLSAMLFAAFMIGLMPLEIALARGRAPMGLIGLVDVATYGRATYVVMAALFAAVLCFSVVAPALTRRLFPTVLLVGQIGLPVFYLALYPARLLIDHGALTKYSTTPALKGLIVVLVVLGFVDVVRRYVRFKPKEGGEFSSLFSPWALFGLLMAFKFGSTSYPLLSSNDYEFGQTLLGWWSYLKGAVPYVDYIAAHGVIEDDLPGFVAKLFYDGTAASIMDATRVTAVVLSLVAFLAVYAFSSSLGLAFICAFFLGKRLSFLFLVPFICLWFSQRLRRDPVQWLAVWLLTVPIVILGVPPFGVVLVAASCLMVLPMVHDLWRSRRRGPYWPLLVALAILLMFAIATPFVPMLMGALRYVSENGPINQVAYGVPWEDSWNDINPRSGFLFEIIRTTWIVAPVYCLLFIYRNWTLRKSPEYRIAPVLVVLAFSLLLIPYTMGRIDIGDFSRGGLATIFGLTVLIPVIAWKLGSRLNKSLLALLIAAGSATLGFSVVVYGSVIMSAVPIIPVGPLRNGAAAHMPNIGNAIVPDAQWQTLQTLNARLDKVLAPGETYLDLTSRNAEMFYFGRPPLLAVTAPYNMVGISEQKRAVSRLSRDLPRVALLDANNLNYDGGGLALRSPLLYRFVVDHYEPFWDNGTIFGFSQQMAHGPNSTILLSLANRTDTQWDRGVSRDRAALRVADITPMSVFAIGSEVRLSNGDTRKVTGLLDAKHEVLLSGSVLNAEQLGYPAEIQATVAPDQSAIFRADLLNTAFAPSRNLGEVPVAWGRSNRTLSKRMTQVASLTAIQPVLHDVVAEGDAYRISGPKPQLDYDLTALGMTGRKAGLLKWTFQCENRTAPPKLTVRWQSDLNAPASVNRSHVTFTADDGVLIVPVDAFADWLLAGHIHQLSLALDDPSACSRIKVGQLQLDQRKVFE